MQRLCLSPIQWITALEQRLALVANNNNVDDDEEEDTVVFCPSARYTIGGDIIRICSILMAFQRLRESQWQSKVEEEDVAQEQRRHKIPFHVNKWIPLLEAANGNLGTSLFHYWFVTLFFVVEERKNDQLLLHSMVLLWMKIMANSTLVHVTAYPWPFVAVTRRCDNAAANLHLQSATQNGS